MPALYSRSPVTLLAASGVALFLFLLLPWYGVDPAGVDAGVAVSGIDTSANAWQAFSYTDILLFLAAVAAIATFVLTGRNPAQAAIAAQAATALGGLGTLLILFRIVDKPGPNEATSLKVGVFLGLIACVSLAYAALQTTQGTSRADDGA